MALVGADDHELRKECGLIFHVRTSEVSFILLVDDGRLLLLLGIANEDLVGRVAIWTEIVVVWSMRTEILSGRIIVG